MEADSIASGRLEDYVYPSPEVIECPYPFFDQAREETPVYRDPATGVFVVLRHEDIAFALQHVYARRGRTLVCAAAGNQRGPCRNTHQRASCADRGDIPSSPGRSLLAHRG